LRAGGQGRSVDRPGGQRTERELVLMLDQHREHVGNACQVGKRLEPTEPLAELQRPRRLLVSEAE
jgi:hypothetical protein